MCPNNRTHWEVYRKWSEWSRMISLRRKRLKSYGNACLINTRKVCLNYKFWTMCDGLIWRKIRENWKFKSFIFCQASLLNPSKNIFGGQFCRVVILFLKISWTVHTGQNGTIKSDLDFYSKIWGLWDQKLILCRRITLFVLWHFDMFNHFYFTKKIPNRT